MPSVESSHDCGGELTSEQGWTESTASAQSWLHGNLASGSHLNLTLLQFLAGRSRAGTTRVLVGLSGSAESSHFHGSLVHQGCKEMV